MESTVTETVLRRDRVVVVAGLATISALAWYYIMTGAGTGMSVVAMSRVAVSPGAFAGKGAIPLDWTGEYWLIMILMWWVMMIAMMVPSASPVILLYARATRHAQTGARVTAAVPTALFASGYLVAWLAFSLAAVGLQFTLERSGLTSSMMMWSLDPWLSAGLLCAAGLYQLVPLKRVCLEHCRAPAHFLSRHWRHGRVGALRMGLHHGAFCVACCWALMALLFVGGIMNLLWIAGLAIFVLIEKITPAGPWLARSGGMVCIAAALWLGVRAGFG